MTVYFKSSGIQECPCQKMLMKWCTWCNNTKDRCHVYKSMFMLNMHPPKPPTRKVLILWLLNLDHMLLKNRQKCLMNISKRNSQTWLRIYTTMSNYLKDSIPCDGTYLKRAIKVLLHKTLL